MKSLRIKKYLSVILAFAVILGCFSISKIDAQAKSYAVTEKTKSYDKYGVGSIMYVSGSNIKINGKAVKKLKKKIKAVKRSSDPYASKAYTGKYFSSSSYSGYKGNYEKYEAAYEKFYNTYKWKKSESYEFKFLKPGTYTISYQNYSTVTKYDCKKYSDSWDDPNRYTVGLIEKHIIKVKVATNTSAIKSIKLGSAIYSYKDSSKKYKSVETTKKNPYLKAASAKLVVKANKGYSVTSIIVRTKDKNGNTIYKQVKNKSKIPINTYKPQSSDKMYLNNSYPETEIYIGYKDNFYGTSTTYSYNETTKKFTITTISRGYKNDYSYHDSNTTYSFKPDKDDPDYGYWTIRRTRDYMETYGNTRTETFYYTK